MLVITSIHIYMISICIWIYNGIQRKHIVSWVSIWLKVSIKIILLFWWKRQKHSIASYIWSYLITNFAEFHGRIVAFISRYSTNVFFIYIKRCDLFYVLWMNLAKIHCRSKSIKKCSQWACWAVWLIVTFTLPFFFIPPKIYIHIYHVLSHLRTSSHTLCY